MPRPFRPSARNTNWLLVIGFCCVGYAMYLRYLVIENQLVGQSCDSGLSTWLCLSRSVGIALHEHQIFGWVALGVALINFIRPTLALFALTLAAASFGVVLHNAGLAGLAAALLIMSLARPAIETV